MSFEAYIVFGLLALFSTILAIGKIQYEKNPKFFESKQKFRKDWRTWKPSKDQSIHSKLTNSNNI